jgi:Protein of unknown function (DUF3108)
MTCPASAWLGQRRAVAAAVACCAAATAGADVQPFSGQYEGRKTIALIPATAKATIELTRSTQFIHYTMQTTITWAFVERRFRDCSVIRIDGEQTLRPLEYVHIDESSPQFNVRTRFDWSHKQARTLIGASTEAVIAELTGPTWDPMSFQVALIALARQRTAGDSETHRVVERGASKEHRVSFHGLVPLPAGGPTAQAHQIVSRKSKGEVVLYVSPPSPLQPPRPLRITIDDVTIDWIASAAASPPSLAEGPVPRCDAGAAR